MNDNEGHQATRRQILKCGSAAAALAALSSNLSYAQGSKRVVVGLWGGDYSRLVSKNIGKPQMESNGWEVVYDEAAAPPRESKVLAERRLTRGSTDVQAFQNALIGKLVEGAALEKLDYSKLPNASYLLPVLKNASADYVIPQIYSGLVLLYNPKLIDPAPTSLADLWDPKYQGRVGLIDLQYVFNFMAASLARSGRLNDVQAAKQALLELKRRNVKLYPTNEAFASALKTEEIGLGMMWKARAVQWQNQNINIKIVPPREGIMLYVQGFGITKNAPNKEGAYAMLNAALTPSAQESFAVDMGYIPTVSNANIPADLRERIGFSEEEVKRMVNVDTDFVTKNDAMILEWWNKDFKG